MCRFAFALLPLLIPASVRADAEPGVRPDAAGYGKTVEPFFKTYCASCHIGEKAKGDFRVDAAALPNDFLDPATRGKWREVVNVLGSHEMPPKKSKQPPPAEVSAVIDWVSAQATRAEIARRSGVVTLRRLNCDEYHNTIRDLVGIDFDVSRFPQDPPAGGFDNNGGALTMSPVQIETYANAARQILDIALVEGPRPKPVQWRFTPKAGTTDRDRVKLDANNPSVIVYCGANKQEGSRIVMHHYSWDRSVGAHQFRVPVAGEYAVRLRAAGRIPDRAAVVKSAEPHLARIRAESDRKDPKGAEYSKRSYDRAIEHFKSDRMYDYGPPRIKLTQRLGPQIRTLAEFDVLGSPDKPHVHEFTARFTPDATVLNFEYAYQLPVTGENWALQVSEDFPRPEVLLEWFEIEGPLYDAWPPTTHTNILFDSPLRRTDERGYAAEVLARLMRKAYRRPVEAAEVSAKMALYDAARKGGVTFVEAIKRPLTAVLVSPHFLYLVEPAGDTPDAARALTDHELAARLSYFLWSSGPDAELLKTADAGRLRDPDERARQIDRLLADPRRGSFVRNFAGQWLNLREVGSNPPAPEVFNRYDRHLELSIVRESEEFFRTVLDEDLDVRNFIKSDFVVINERLGRFYGIPGVRGDEFRKVSVPKGVHRGGVVTQASVLCVTSNGTRTSPVKRGTFVLKTMLGIDPGLPLANAGEIAPKVPGIDKATVRKRLEIHRQLDQCARCHDKIDPLGFALENFNGAGEWRDQEGFGPKGRVEKNDPKIDASAQMIDGTRIVGVDGLQAALLKQEDLFLQCLAAKLLTFALGRELGLADQPTVRAAVAHAKQNGRTLKSLVRFIANSEPFQTK
jgi:mono/diheme cytochrome c family protein